jgi:Ion channel
MADSANEPAGPATASRGRVVAAGRAIVSPDSYGLVLLLILFTYVFSVTVTASWASSLVVTVQITTVWVALRVSQARRNVRRAVGMLLLISAVLVVINLFLAGPTWERGGISLVSSLLYLVAPFSITRHLLFRRQVDRETVLGAIDIYLLIGIMFAFVDRFLSIVQQAPFFGASGNGTTPQFLFFSFTTLTTTGYGNLVPAANPGQSLAVAEMLIGQLFLVTAVAKVVNAFTPLRIPPSR